MGVLEGCGDLGSLFKAVSQVMVHQVGNWHDLESDQSLVCQFLSEVDERALAKSQYGLHLEAIVQRLLNGLENLVVGRFDQNAPGGRKAA